MPCAPSCLKCDVERELLDCVPIANGHEMLTYICPTCSGLFRLVVAETSTVTVETVEVALA